MAHDEFVTMTTEQLNTIQKYECVSYIEGIRHIVIYIVFYIVQEPQKMYNTNVTIRKLFTFKGRIEKHSSQAKSGGETSGNRHYAKPVKRYMNRLS